MNVDRFLRDVEGRLAPLDSATRAEVLDVLREAIARERRRLDPALTVEQERERRVAAEELREAVEAIHRPARPDEALDEVLKQLARVVGVDIAVVASLEPGVRSRVVAARGAEVAAGVPVDGPALEEIVASPAPVAVAEAEGEGRPFPVPVVPAPRSWAALPLLLEGEVVGVLLGGRLAIDAFTEAELHRAKAVASAAAAALRKAQLAEQVRRYAAMLEQAAAVDQRVFEGATPEAVAHAILEGAGRVGRYRGGLLVLKTPRGPVVAAALGEGFVAALGRPAPPDLVATVSRRLEAPRMLEVAEVLGTVLPAEQAYLVPLATVDAHIGSLVLLDPDGESPDDRLMESYGTRAAAAWRHAALHHPSV